MVGGQIEVSCSACGQPQTCQLVQSVNTRKQPEMKARLLAGDLNVLACACGKRTPLAANVLLHDPDADFYCHVCPGDPTTAIQAFTASGVTGTRRIVPSLNALVEKVKLLDAGILDWAAELNKVMLLSQGDINRVLLFDGADDQLLHWILFDGPPRRVSSARDAYAKLADKTDYAPKADELQIDRAWAVDVARRIVWDTN